MKRSTDRIRTMHAGSLPRPDDVREMVAAKATGDPVDEEQLDGRLTEAVADVVRQQIECGMDSINDGELSKTNFTNYANERLGGIELRTFAPGEGPEPEQISARDRLAFPGYFDSPRGFVVRRPRDKQLFCVGPITYAGAELVQSDIAYSIEASNPRHQHEWEIWKDVTLPEGAIFIPGVVGHFSDFVEHPKLVAERLLRFASIVGKENLMAGTDCGLGMRVGSPDICWAKFQAMSEGARLASEALWG